MVTEYKAAMDESFYLVHTILHNDYFNKGIVSKGGKLEDLVIILNNKKKFRPYWDSTFEKVQIVFEKPFKPIKLDERILENIAKENDMIVENYPIPDSKIGYEFSFYAAVKKLFSKKKYSKDPVANVGPQAIYFDFSTSKIPSQAKAYATFCDILDLYIK